MRHYLLAIGVLAVDPKLAQGVAHGAFLVAQPSLNDSLFGRIVRLIEQPSGSPGRGPVGVIINKPAAISLSCVCPQHPRCAASSIPYHSRRLSGPSIAVFLLRTTKAPTRETRVLDDV